MSNNKSDDQQFYTTYRTEQNKHLFVTFTAIKFCTKNWHFCKI